MLEFARCQNDIAYFSENYVKICHPIKGTIQIELNKMQHEIIDQFNKPIDFTKIIDRQQGKSTIANIIYLHNIIFEIDRVNVVLSPSPTMAKAVIENIKFMFDLLPDWFKHSINITSHNKHTLNFSNGTTILSYNKLHILRGRSISMLYLDEFDFMPERQLIEFMANFYPVAKACNHCKLFGLSSSKSRCIMRF
jgi:hypothetical protein